jgi:propanol-preferring alcohol dehydrogenase
LSRSSEAARSCSFATSRSSARTLDVYAESYADLWGERSIRWIANLTRADGDAFLALAGAAAIAIRARTYPLEDAGRALDDLRAGRLEGAAVLVAHTGPRP